MSDFFDPWRILGALGAPLVTTVVPLVTIVVPLVAIVAHGRPYSIKKYFCLKLHQYFIEESAFQELQEMHAQTQEPWRGGASGLPAQYFVRTELPPIWTCWKCPWANIGLFLISFGPTCWTFRVPRSRELKICKKCKYIEGAVLVM